MTAQKRFELLKLKLTEELVAILVDEKGISIPVAFDMVYQSRTYAKLSDPNTKLYIQSVGYVYSLFEDEIKEKTDSVAS
ncbi:MAG: hypothetical protein IKX30_09705 [Victivallales bacterium]|nr:hypothetical protein [Victivallales bacterium]